MRVEPLQPFRVDAIHVSVAIEQVRFVFAVKEHDAEVSKLRPRTVVVAGTVVVVAGGFVVVVAGTA